MQLAKGRNPQFSETQRRRPDEPPQRHPTRDQCKRNSGQSQESHSKYRCRINVARRKDLIVDHPLKNDRHNQLQGGPDQGKKKSQPQTTTELRCNSKRSKERPRRAYDRLLAHDGNPSRAAASSS
jgi:hypothetical protein